MIGFYLVTLSKPGIEHKIMVVGTEQAANDFAITQAARYGSIYDVKGAVQPTPELLTALYQDHIAIHNLAN